jgi:endonuclease/exonuclease/phosphatase family metal-dependent hydrolase
MTYNVHRCIGADGVLSPERIAAVISRYLPDVVALQELDVGHARTGRADQPRVLADLLGMSHHFFPAVERADDQYGDAVLSRLPMRLVRAGPLPTLPDRPRLERRGALWVELDWGGQPLQLLNTHLGLKRRERLAQAEALLSREWLGHPDCREPRVLCGDLNALPRSRVYWRLRSVLRDAQIWPGVLRPRGTFPARLPLLRIDHILYSTGVLVTDARVPHTRLTRVASDHLPLYAGVRLP